MENLEQNTFKITPRFLSSAKAVPATGQGFLDELKVVLSDINKSKAETKSKNKRFHIKKKAKVPDTKIHSKHEDINAAPISQDVQPKRIISLTDELIQDAENTNDNETLEMAIRDDVQQFIKETMKATIGHANKANVPSNETPKEKKNSDVQTLEMIRNEVQNYMKDLNLSEKFIKRSEMATIISQPTTYAGQSQVVIEKFRNTDYGTSDSQDTQSISARQYSELNTRQQYNPMNGQPYNNDLELNYVNAEAIRYMNNEILQNEQYLNSYACGGPQPPVSPPMNCIYDGTNYYGMPVLNQYEDCTFNKEKHLGEHFPGNEDLIDILKNINQRLDNLQKDVYKMKTKLRKTENEINRKNSAVWNACKKLIHKRQKKSNAYNVMRIRSNGLDNKIEIVPKSEEQNEALKLGKFNFY